MEANRSNGKQAAERLAEEATQARQEVEKAEQVKLAAESVVGEITGRILDHDGGAGIEKLAAERAAAEARVEALSARLAHKRKAHETATAAAVEAALALDEENLVTATAKLRAADDDLEKRVEGFAEEVASALVAVEALRASTWTLSSRVQSARGIPIDRQTPPGPALQSNHLGERFGVLLHEALYRASKVA